MSTLDWKQSHFAFLDQMDRDDPLNVLREFASHDSLYEMRIRYWNIFAESIEATPPDDWEDGLLAGKMFFLQLTLRLTESIYQLVQLIDEGKFDCQGTVKG